MTGRISICRLTVLAALALLLVPATAAAKKHGWRRPASVEIGGVRLATPNGGPETLLVGVRYPIQLAAHRVHMSVAMRLPGEGVVHRWGSTPLAGAGTRHRPDRRRAFGFVHRIDVDRSLAAQIDAASGPPLVDVSVGAVLDANADGTPELRSTDRETHVAGARSGPACSSVPVLRVEPGETASTRLPACSFDARWRIGDGVEHGSARIHDGRLVYHAERRFRGTDSLTLDVRPSGASSSAAKPTAPVQIVVGTAEGVSVRALGDSVTAGFGYYGNGEEMSVFRLLSCRPGATFFDDACSSNSLTRDNQGKTVEYSADFGLANNISWAAQWANANGVTDYENLAVSGSEPKTWLPGGQLHGTLTRLETEDPDYILMTLGANPLLSEMLFGFDHMGCAIYADAFGKYRECIETAFKGIELHQRLKKVYSELVSGTHSTIYLMQYPLSVPSVAIAYTTSQIAEMVNMINEEIAKTAAEVSTTRLRVIAPPHFNVGLDISPVYPAEFQCGKLISDLVDGPSVQSRPTQLELRGLHPVEFCGGPEEGPPWVISGDTGIHPSAAGYAQMAARIPAPR